MLMPFEGITYPALEDEYSILALEPTHTDEDEDYYTDEILTGNHDMGEADYGDFLEADFDPDGWKGPQNRYDAWVYGE